MPRETLCESLYCTLPFMLSSRTGKINLWLNNGCLGHLREDSDLLERRQRDMSRET